MAWCCLQWMLSIDYKKYSHILWSHTTTPFIPDMMRLHRCWPFDKKPCLCLEVPVHGTELLWTRSMDIFWSLTRAEGRKEAVDCVENNWFDAQHTLAHCSAPECLCRIVSRLCIVRFSNWQLHRVGWRTWLGYAQLTMGYTDTTGLMHTLALPLLSAGCHTVARLCIEQFNKQCASNRGLINTVHWTRLFSPWVHVTLYQGYS